MLRTSLAAAAPLAVALAVLVAAVVAVVAGARDMQQEKLPALALVGGIGANFLLDHQRAGLHVHEERALAEVLRRVDDPAGLPATRKRPRGAGVDVRRALVGRLIDPRDDERSAATLQVVRPDPRRRAGAQRVLVVAARILLEEHEVLRRLDVVGLVDEVDGPGAGGPTGVTSTRIERLSTFVSSFRS